MIGILAAGVPVDQISAQTKKRENSKKRVENTASASGKKGSSAKSSSTRKKAPAKKRNNASRKPETSADMQRRQRDTQQEIARTKEEIRRNEEAVKRGLRDLGKLQTDISTGEKSVAEARGKVTTLQNQIGTLQADIERNEAHLQKMRADYLKAVKKIRAKRNTNSDLAFIFASKDFNQAMRRMRYLRQFSEWRQKKSDEIGRHVSEMKRQTDLLARTKAEKAEALRVQEQAQNQLRQQYEKQDAVVVELKKTGKALNTHLARKQAEANSLKSRIAALIAEEQRKAEAERKAREAEEQRRIEAERKAEEARKAELAMAEKKEAEAVAEIEKKATTKADKKSDKKAEAKSDRSGRPGKTDEKVSKNIDYAEARRRRPRSQAGSDKSTSGKMASNTGSKNASTGAGNFAAMRGSLPRPVAGQFTVTSQFGRHSHPDLPDVMYDNPGIDAETAAGAAALAVFGGKVSGVYVVPGYSTVIIVNHGGYYTVYGNIAAPSVKVGDMVKQGQTLGSVASEDGDSSHGSIHFEVWRNREKQNPLDWIR